MRAVLRAGCAWPLRGAMLTSSGCIVVLVGPSPVHQRTDPPPPMRSAPWLVYRGGAPAHLGGKPRWRACLLLPGAAGALSAAARFCSCGAPRTLEYGALRAGRRRGMSDLLLYGFARWTYERRETSRDRASPARSWSRQSRGDRPMPRARGAGPRARRARGRRLPWTGDRRGARPPRPPAPGSA